MLCTHYPSVSCAHPKNTLLSRSSGSLSRTNTQKSAYKTNVEFRQPLFASCAKMIFPNLLFVVANNQVQRALAKWRTEHAERAQQNKSDTRAKIEAISVYRHSATISMPTYWLKFTSGERKRAHRANTEIDGKERVQWSKKRLRALR